MAKNEHVGQCLESCCESCLEWRLAWTSVASKNATLKDVISKLRADSGERYAQGKDNEASFLRQLANQFEKEQKEASGKLQEFIKLSSAPRKCGGSKK